MNAPTKIPFDVTGGTAATPADLELVVRDRRFDRSGRRGRWWLNDDPVATAWYNSLSASFPRGEAFFIEAVKAHRDGVSPRLAADIRDFIAQEVNHSREHVAFNRAVIDAGYDLTRVDQRIAEFIDMTRGRPAFVNLAATIALEHFTAMMAHEILSNPRHFSGAHGDSADLWRWHAIEEIEHKSVAYDTWLHATKDWSRWKRWKLKSLMMAVITYNFIRYRSEAAFDLLAQDGIRGFRTKWRLFTYLVVRPGMLRRILPQWLAYFLPGFHPWNLDDRALVARTETAASS